MNDIKLAIEDDSELLRKYGLAVACNNSVEYLLGQYLILVSKLNQADIETVNDLLDFTALKKKVELSAKFFKNKEIVKYLNEAVQDRNLLAHGVSASTNNQHILMLKRKNVDLDQELLDKIIKRDKNILGMLYAEILSAGFKLKSP